MSAVHSIQAATPLANAESEYAVIASMLYDSRRIDRVADILRAEHFSEPFLGRMFGLLVDAHNSGNPLNGLTIRPYLEGDPDYIALKGHEFISGMTSGIALLVDSKATAKQVRELARRRELVDGLRIALELGSDVHQSIETVVDAAEAAVVDASDQTDTIRQVSAAGAMKALMKRAENPKRSIKSKTVTPMDDLLGGMRPTELIIGGGRPGMGKTAAALSFALGAAQNGFGVLFVSLEMGQEELAARMAADLAFDGHSGVPYDDINSDNPSQRALNAMHDAERMLEDIPFHIIAAGGMTLNQLELRIRRFKRRFAAKGHSLDLVVVDYLQLLRTDTRANSAYEAVSEISRRLKGMAQDHDVAVFALAQLSRAVEQRADKRPQLSDFRDSGQIEQDADAVLFLYREEYYLQKKKAPKSDEARAAHEQALSEAASRIDFICAKRRNGRIGDRSGFYFAHYQAVRGSDNYQEGRR